MALGRWDTISFIFGLSCSKPLTGPVIKLSSKGTITHLPVSGDMRRLILFAFPTLAMLFIGFILT